MTHLADYRNPLFLFILFLIPVNTLAAGLWTAPTLLEGTTKLSAEELMELKAEFPNLILIDSRPRGQYDNTVIEGAVAMPSLAGIPDKMSAQSNDKFLPVVLFCAGPNSSHSYRAAKTLVTLGYLNVFWFRGGMQEWLEKGMPVVTQH